MVMHNKNMKFETPIQFKIGVGNDVSFCGLGTNP